MNIRTKIMAGYVLVSLLTIIISGLSYQQMTSLKREIDHLTGVNAKNLQLIDQLVDKGWATHFYVNRFLQMHQFEDEQLAGRNLEELKQLLEAARYTDTYLDHPESFQAIDRLIHPYEEKYNNLVLRVNALKKQRISFQKGTDRLLLEMIKLLEAKRISEENRYLLEKHSKKLFVLAPKSIVMLFSQNDSQALHLSRQLERHYEDTVGIAAQLAETNPDLSGKIEAFSELQEEYIADFRGINALIKKMNEEIEVTIFRVTPQIIDNSHRLAEETWEKNRETGNEVSAQVKTSLQTIVSLAVLTIILGIVLGYILASRLTRQLLLPIRQLDEGATALAARKFETRLQTDSIGELGHLAENFNIMAETLEDYEDKRQQAFTDIFHELSTPLAILRGEVTAMLDGIRELSKGNLESLHAEILHLGKLVMDYRELSLVESGAVLFDKVNLNPVEVLQDALMAFESRFDSQQIEVDLVLVQEGNCLVEGDGDRLKQLFRNLLENTLRYTDSPGKLRITQRLDNGSQQLIFEDSAPAVPEEALARLFERFYRVEQSRNRATGGSGLGLSICQYIVKEHGGSITISASSLGGLRIGIVFPTII
ncbi:MAG: HAMP domain-containing protein [Proteobacteria bacterium]|nr:HAMP domain-containing protein [Pseudomonadota bacterium]